MADPILTFARLRELLDYYPETGLFVWRVRTSNRIHVGDVAGSPNGYGYMGIQVDGVRYESHRLAWLWVHGVWPPDLIDHINGIPDDNRLCNLRPATYGENKQNVRGARSDSKSGILGVSWHKRDLIWVASLMIAGRVVYYSSHDTLESACAARLAAELKYHPFSPEFPRSLALQGGEVEGRREAPDAVLAVYIKMVHS